SYFEDLTSIPAACHNKRIEVDPSWEPSKRCYFRIVNRLKEGIEGDVIAAITDRISENVNAKTIRKDMDRLILEAPKEDAHNAAVQTLNDTLLPAMKEVGDKFGSGELILPFVLKSAECMKAAVAELEKYLIRKEGVSKGKVVL